MKSTLLTFKHGALYLTLILFFCAAAKASAEQKYEGTHAITTEIITSGLHHPWGMAFLPNGDVLMTERRGKLKKLNISDNKIVDISGLPKIKTGGQGGLLDVALDPKFAENSFIYFSYVAEDKAGRSGTEVARAVLKGDKLENLTVIFAANPKVKSGYHFGSRLLFENDTTLYVSLGERYAYKDDAQNNQNHHGVLVRINSDGSVPSDNPFTGQSDVALGIYSYGHRNIQGLAMQPGDGQIWAHEHGPKGGDELNLIKPAVNYGWPKITYGIDYSGAIISEHTHMEGMEQPVTYWVPSIAPSGMIFYEGDKFPKWNNQIFIGALRQTHLRRVKLDGNKVVEQEELLKDLGQRIRDVELGPDGYIYVLTDQSNGQLIKVLPK